MLAFARRLARAFAVVGGVVLIGLVVLIVASIVGRSLLGLGPVPGDYELAEAGIGFAVFAFFPWCQVNRGHATVDVFTAGLGERANRLIDIVSELLMTLVLALIAWRLVAGTLDKARYGETSFILQFPVWWAFAAASVAAVAAAFVSAVMLGVRVREVATGRSIIAGPSSGGHA